MADSSTVFNPGWLDSGFFLFLIGPQRRKYSVHVGVLNDKPKLEELVDKAICDSATYCDATAAAVAATGTVGCHEWPDVDTDAFERFISYLYTGDFEAPLFYDYETMEVDYFDENDGKFGNCFTKSDTDFEGDVVFNEAWNLIGQKYFCACTEVPTRYRVNREDTNLTSDRGCFVAIASVYALAHRFEMEALMKLAKAKLHCAMVSFPGQADIYSLLRFCMVEAGAHPLRKMAFERAALTCYWVIADEQEDKLEAVVKEFPEVATNIIKHFRKFTTHFTKGNY